MDETCCFAYNYLGVGLVDSGDPISMESFLYHDDYSMYNEDADGGHQLDNLIYYLLFEC